MTDVIGGWAFGATLAAIAFAVAAWASPDGRLALARRRREAPRSSAAKSAPEPRDGVAERSLTR